MGIFYEKMVYNRFYGLKKVFWLRKKIVNNDFEKSLHFEGAGGRGQFGKSLHFLKILFRGLPLCELTFHNRCVRHLNG